MSLDTTIYTICGAAIAVQFAGKAVPAHWWPLLIEYAPMIGGISIVGAVAVHYVRSMFRPASHRSDPHYVERMERTRGQR